MKYFRLEKFPKSEEGLLSQILRELNAGKVKHYTHFSQDQRSQNLNTRPILAFYGSHYSKGHTFLSNDLPFYQDGLTQRIGKKIAFPRVKNGKIFIPVLTDPNITLIYGELRFKM